MSPSGCPSLVDRWSGEPFGRGDDRWTGNVVSGSFQARDIISFDYGYSTRDSRDNSETVHRYGVLAMRMPGSLPPLRVAPEGLVDDMVETLGVGAVARELGYADIRFESGQFNNAFRVTATDERFAHAVVHPRMMEMLLFQGEIAWRFEGDTVIGWWGEERGKHEAADVIRRLNLLRWVLDLVPPYVWKDYAGVDPRPGLA